MPVGDIGKVAVIVGVGASQGLGAAIARRTAREGLHTFVAGRTQQRLEAIVAEIESAGGRATAVPTDTTITSDVENLLDRAIDEGGSLDFVAYNAGNNQFSSLLDMDDAFFENLWRLCCFGGFLVGREAARRMTAGQGSGSILFTGATASMRARPPFTAFASAKAALRGLSQGMAREFGPQGIHVGHVVIDGMIDGEQLHGRFPELKERMGEMGMLDVDAIADAFWTLHTQHPSAWTWELDVRPFKEKW
ncbi:MAG: SDR family NAD(P)-dependent oxidoreductase [Myxococcales bacterium]|nr:SDR family NAD(P)-dependent oxidoreductase [Myxococcales bacterium]HIK86024.1 SDR family NAD(P)-dependent oxidoreductase [Myxococcales bacterium]